MVRGDRVEELRAAGRVQPVRPLLDETEPEMDVAEELALGRRPEPRWPSELERTPDIVEKIFRQNISMGKGLGLMSMVQAVRSLANAASK